MPERGAGRLPPNDFDQRPVQTEPAVPNGEPAKHGDWYRIALPLVVEDKGKGSEWLAWDSRRTSRFSHPASPYPVLYLGQDMETCFWEAFGEDLLDTKPGARMMMQEAELKSRHLVRFLVPRQLRIFNTLDGAALRAIGADNNTFRMPYPITQAWARALMNHPDGPDGLFYESRLSPFAQKRCLALFGRPYAARAGVIRPQDQGPLIENVEMVKFFVRYDICL